MIIIIIISSVLSSFQVRRVQGEVASVPAQSGLQPQERHSLHSGVGDHRLQPQVPRGRQVPLVHGATLHSVHRRPSTTPFQELHRPPPAAYHRQIQGKVPTVSAAKLAEKQRSEDRDSHDLPITRDRNDRDRECHLTYKH